MSLEKYICELLYRHECVIVPEFGAFITNYEPASIQSATHAILPPRKYLVFNSNLTINDGLLASEISRKMQLSFDEAMHFIRREVTAWQERLKAGKTIIITGIGAFSINKSGKPEFKPDLEQNFFDEAFGLSAVVVPPIQKRRRRPKSEPVYYYKPSRKTSARAVRRLAWAAVITIPLMAASIWSFMNYDTLKQYAVQHSGIVKILKTESMPVTPGTPTFEAEEHLFNGVSESEMAVDSSTEISLPGDETLASDSVIEVNIPEPGNTLAMSSATEEVAFQPASITGRAYHIIIGSFESEINARHLVDELISSGWNASMVASSQGMHRVSITSFSNKQEALQQLTRIREGQNANAWLLRI